MKNTCLGLLQLVPFTGSRTGSRGQASQLHIFLLYFRFTFCELVKPDPIISFLPRQPKSYRTIVLVRLPYLRKWDVLIIYLNLIYAILVQLLCNLCNSYAIS